jgi:two-component system chemotaxis response regulator CheY
VPICLVVDESAVVRAVLRSMLNTLGFTVSEAVDGIEALDRCRSAPPSLVVVDWNLPGLDGPGFVKALRGAPGIAEAAQPLVLFCTGESSRGHIQAGLDAGADEYIMRPFDTAILRDKLQALGLLEGRP